MSEKGVYQLKTNGTCVQAVVLSSADCFIRSFFENEVYFLKEPKLQEAEWGNANHEEIFGWWSVFFTDTWLTFVENRKKCGSTLSERDFQTVHKLYEMCDAFQLEIDYPKTPREYRALLNHPKWKEIQKYAGYLFTELYPRLPGSKS